MNVKGQTNIEIEISPNCNLKCPNCNVRKRLHIDNNKKQICSSIEDKIIKFIPKKTRLLFVGLGEPTLPQSQLKILKILKERSDLKGFIQTNGSFKIISDLIPYIKQNKLEIALSYDFHHVSGGQKLRIQKHLVKSLSICVSRPVQILSKEFINSLKQFNNLNKILLDPLISKNCNQILTEFKEVEYVCIELKKIFSNITFYIQVFKHWKAKNNSFNKYYLDCVKDKISIEYNWLYSIKYYYLVNIENQEEESLRILTNGKVLTNLTLIDLSWDGLEKKTKLYELEEFKFQK